MALTELELAIGNQALAMIGHKSVSYTDTSTKDTGTGGNPYAKLDLIYAQTRNALLRYFEWNFAKTRLSLSSTWATGTIYTTDQYVWVDSELFKCNTAHTSTTWNTDYVMDGSEYVLDGEEYVRDDTIIFYWDLVTDRPKTYWDYRYALPADFSRFRPEYLRDYQYFFAIEGNYLLTDEESIDIEYIAKVTDTTLFDDLFTEILIHNLALKLIVALAGIGYVVIADKNDIRRDRDDLLKRAKAINRQEVNQTGYYEWSNARYGTGKV